MNYPFRTEAEQAALDRLAGTPYATDDAPHLKTQRITLSADYDHANLADKTMVDAQGVADNWYRYEQSRLANLAGRDQYVQTVNVEVRTRNEDLDNDLDYEQDYRLRIGCGMFTKEQTKKILKAARAARKATQSK